MKSFDYKTYLSPFTWRYGSDKMRQIFSEENKFKLWRKVWVALAKAQNKAGLVSNEELKDLENNQDNLEIERILEIEKQTQHDVVSALKEFAEKAKVGGGKIHLGATSQDIGDNAEILRDREALIIIEKKLIAVLALFAQKIKQYANLPCLGYTHLQPAEPTTLGYRFAFYAQDLLIDLDFLHFVQKTIKGKGLKGAVGTSASFVALLKDKKISAEELEKLFLEELGIDAVLIASQVYPRKFDYLILASLSSIASSLSKFAFDLRIMQSPGFGEWQEPFGKFQVGSSAMPFKRNPFTSEKICSLARFVNLLPQVALGNASSSLLERTLDDSANKRVIMAEGFLATEDILLTVEKILAGLVINEKKIALNLNQYAPFLATEGIILEAVKNGADRQKIHEVLRKLAQNGGEMEKLLMENKEITKFVKREELKKLLNIKNHIGNAAEKALTISNKIDKLT